MIASLLPGAGAQGSVVEGRDPGGRSVGVEAGRRVLVRGRRHQGARSERSEVFHKTLPVTRSHCPSYHGGFCFRGAPNQGPPRSDGARHDEGRGQSKGEVLRGSSREDFPGGVPEREVPTISGPEAGGYGRGGPSRSAGPPGKRSCRGGWRIRSRQKRRRGPRGSLRANLWGSRSRSEAGYRWRTS